MHMYTQIQGGERPGQETLETIERTIYLLGRSRAATLQQQEDLNYRGTNIGEFDCLHYNFCAYIPISIFQH